MEFLAFALQIIFVIGFVIVQIFLFALKLVPIGFLFWLIEKLFIGGEDLVNIMLSGHGMTVLLIVFILAFGYIILIGLLHMIVNINVFANMKKAFGTESGDVKNKKIVASLDSKSVNELANSFMRKVSIAKGLNVHGKVQGENGVDTSNHFIKDTQMVRDNIFLSFALFQGGLLSGKEAFYKLVDKFGKWSNILLLLLLGLLIMFLLNIKQEIKLANGETALITNGYDYINYKLSSVNDSWLPFASAGISKVKNTINDSITFRDKKIQTLAKLYYYSTGLKWFTHTELVESKTQFNPININISTATTDDPEKLSQALGKNRNNWLSILGKDDLKYYKDSKKIGVGLSIYADELASIMNRKEVNLYPSEKNISSCIANVNASKTKNIYFMPKNIYNSTLYANDEGGESYNDEELNKALNAFEKTFVKLKNGYFATSLSSVINFESKGEFAIPGVHKDTDSALIGLYFIVGTNSKGNQYLIDQNLWNKFKKEIANGAILSGKNKISNIKMLKKSNHLITDFCYGFSTFKQLYNGLHVEEGLKRVDKQSLEYNIKVPFIEYGDFFSKLYNKYLDIVDRGKLSKQSNLEKQEVAYYLFHSGDIRIRTGLSQSIASNEKGADALKAYFYMFGDETTKRLDYMIGSLFIKQAVDGVDGLHAFLERFQSYHQDDTLVDLNQMLQSPVVQDIFGKYIGLDTGLKDFHYKLLETIKKTHQTTPGGAVFNLSNIDITKNRFFNGYRGENFGFFGGDSVLKNYKIQNLIYSLQNEIKLANGLNVSSNTLGDENSNSTVMFFGESYDSIFSGNDGQTYKKKGIMIGIIPLVESEVPFMNSILFVLYLISYLIMIMFMIWFSGIGQLAFNYYMHKRDNQRDDEWSWGMQLKDLLIRFIAFVIFMRIYFIFTTF